MPIPYLWIILCITDGSKDQNSTSGTYSIDRRLSHFGFWTKVSIFTAKFSAILFYLYSSLYLPPFPLISSSSPTFLTHCYLFRTYSPVIPSSSESICYPTLSPTSRSLFHLSGFRAVVVSKVKWLILLPRIRQQIVSPYLSLWYPTFNPFTAVWFFKNGRKNGFSPQLLPIKPSAVNFFQILEIPRSQETILTPLQIGHFTLTHAYLLSNLGLSTCSPFTVSRIFHSCPATQHLRTHLNLPKSLPNLLNYQPNHFSSLQQFLIEAWNSVDRVHEICSVLNMSWRI